MVLNSLFSSLILFGSFSVRTPNIQPNPDDYEISLGIKNEVLLMSHQLERELGVHYIDDIAWILYDKDIMYIKSEYFNKQSKGIAYLKLDCRYKPNTSWGYGITFRTGEDAKINGGWDSLFSMGYNKKTTYKNITLEAAFGGYYSRDFFEYEELFKIAYKISKNINVYNEGEIYRLKGKTFYNAKVGIEIIL